MTENERIEAVNSNTSKSNISICTYNINRLYNKLLFPYFFEFLCQYDIFICLETHVLDSTKEQQISKYFPNYSLYFKQAFRRATRGRGMSGFLIGWKCELQKHLNITCKVIEEDDIISVLIKSGQDEIVVIPIYLREENWNDEFYKLKSYLQNLETGRTILLGDINARIGCLQQLYVTEIHGDTAIVENRKSKDSVSNRRVLQ